MIDFINTTPEKILAIVALAGALWQLWLLLGALAIMRSGRNVTYGVGPGLIAVIAGTILWVIQ